MAMDGNSELPTLGEHAVYPGHPLTVALCIIRAFADLNEAETTPEGEAYPRALTSGCVPGAGGNVWSGLTLLRFMRDGSVPDVFEWANENWASCDSQAKGGWAFPGRPHDPDYYIQRWKKGQEQADRFKAAFVKEAAEWLR